MANKRRRNGVRRLVWNALSLLVAVAVLTGCWDRLEIEERAVVLGISVDLADAQAAEEEEEGVSHLQNKAPDEDMIRVAVQIALPGRIPLGPGESGGGRGSDQTVWILEVTGHTIDDAIMNLQQQLSGRLFFGHLRTIVVSEAVARQGLKDLNDYFRRNSEVRRMAWMMISKGDAAEVMRAAPKLERVPALYLMSTMDSAVQLGKFPNEFVGMFWSRSSKKGQEGLLPYIEIKKDENINILGLAYFRNSAMVGKTRPLEIGAYMGIKGINPAGYRGIIPINEAGDTVTLYASHRESTIDVAIEKGLPKFTVNIVNELNLEEKNSETVLIDDQEIIEQIEKKDAIAAVKLHESFIKQTQKHGSDIFGFGEYVRAKQPAYWNEHIKTKEKWREMYKDVSVEVHIEIKIRRVGMKRR